MNISYVFIRNSAESYCIHVTATSGEICQIKVTYQPSYAILSVLLKLLFSYYDDIV